MKKIFLTIACFIAAATAVWGQSIAGVWQGTLPITENPRIVLKISKADDGSLHGVFYRIDQYPDSLPLSAVSFVAPNLSVSAVILDTGFHGKLSADGKSISGTWTQNKQTYPLTFSLATPDTLWKYSGITPSRPMSATADPVFEVATIKPSPPSAKGGRTFGLRSHRFTTTNTTFGDLVRFAYHVRTRQIEGAPSWLDDMRFDIAAEPDTDGIPSEDQDRLMLRKLLADRFQFKMHMVQRVFPVFALTAEDGASKLTRSGLSDDTHGHIFTKQTADGELQAQFAYETMAEFTDILMNFIKDRQILDDTRLKGPFDFTLTEPMSAINGSSGEEETTNEFIRALQPLGFKLVPKKELIDVLVIDHIEQPSAN